MTAIGDKPKWVCACGRTSMRGLDSAICPSCRVAVYRTRGGALITTANQGEFWGIKPGRHGVTAFCSCGWMEAGWPNTTLAQTRLDGHRETQHAPEHASRP